MSINGKEILVIDDDTQCQFFMSKILNNVGVKLSQAISYDDAIEKLQECTPHLIITDIKLGSDKDGLDILKFFKSDPKFKQIPVFVITADASKQTIFQSLALGAQEYILKPISAREIIQKIRRCFLDYESPVVEFLDNEGNIKCEFIELFKDDLSIEIEADINLRAINELSCILQGPMRFAKETKVDLQNNLLDSIGAEHIGFRSIENSRNIEAGVFSTRFSLIGINEKSAQKIRKLRVTKK